MALTNLLENLKDIYGQSNEDNKIFYDQEKLFQLSKDCWDGHVHDLQQSAQSFIKTLKCAEKIMPILTLIAEKSYEDRLPLLEKHQLIDWKNWIKNLIADFSTVVDNKEGIHFLGKDACAPGKGPNHSFLLDEGSGLFHQELDKMRQEMDDQFNQFTAMLQRDRKVIYHDDKARTQWT